MIKRIEDWDLLTHWAADPSKSFEQSPNKSPMAVASTQHATPVRQPESHHDQINPLSRLVKEIELA